MKKIEASIMDAAVAAYTEGASATDAARAHGIGETTLRRELLARGVRLRTLDSITFTKKLCAACGEYFQPTGGKQVVCPESYCREWLLDNPKAPALLLGDHAPHGTMRKYVTGCRCEECRDANNDHKRWDRHRMNRPDYEGVLAWQGGGCALCGGPQTDIRARSFDVDHSHGCPEHEHQNGRQDNQRHSCYQCWRGLLCRTCNQHLERQVGHAYIRELEGVATDQDKRVLEYVRNPPAQAYLRSLQESPCPSSLPNQASTASPQPLEALPTPDPSHTKSKVTGA